MIDYKFHHAKFQAKSLGKSNWVEYILYPLYTWWLLFVPHFCYFTSTSSCGLYTLYIQHLHNSTECATSFRGKFFTIQCLLLQKWYLAFTDCSPVCFDEGRVWRVGERMSRRWCNQNHWNVELDLRVSRTQTLHKRLWAVSKDSSRWNVS